MPEHLALPVALTGTGRLATVAQDSAADVAQSLALLIDTRPGERRAETDYGVPDPLFGGLDVTTLTKIIVNEEDRADLTYAEAIARGVIDLAQVHGDSTALTDALTGQEV